MSDNRTKFKVLKSPSITPFGTPKTCAKALLINLSRSKVDVWEVENNYSTPCVFQFNVFKLPVPHLFIYVLLNHAFIHSYLTSEQVYITNRQSKILWILVYGSGPQTLMTYEPPWKADLFVTLWLHSLRYICYPT